MKEKAIALLNQLRSMWASLSTVKRIALVTVATGVLIAISAISFFGSQERYAYVFTELNSEDASAIVEKLKELKIPHKIEAGGTADRKSVV
mgnify:CR=1 FL=1